MKKTSLKLLTILLAAVLLMNLFSACGGKHDTKTSIKVAALKGPTGIGMVRLMEESENNQTKNDYAFTLAGAPEEISGKLISGELDIAAIPSNLAAVLFQKTQGKVKLLAVNTLGVLFVVTKEENISSMADLKGKTVYLSGKGSTPEYVFNDLLQKNGLNPEKDVQIEFKTEHAEIASLLSSGEATVAVLPEPFVTSVMQKDQEVKVSLNLTEEWEKSAGESGGLLAMGCMVVRSEFLEKNKQAVDLFLQEYRASTEYANSHVTETAALVEKQGIMKASIAEIAIPKCNIVYLDGEECKAAITPYLNTLFEADPKSVGGALPDEAFYYLP